MRYFKLTTGFLAIATVAIRLEIDVRLPVLRDDRLNRSWQTISVSVRAVMPYIRLDNYVCEFHDRRVPVEIRQDAVKENLCSVGNIDRAVL